jgi:hypothetical protein
VAAQGRTRDPVDDEEASSQDGGSELDAAHADQRRRREEEEQGVAEAGLHRGWREYLYAELRPLEPHYGRPPGVAGTTRIGLWEDREDAQEKRDTAMADGFSEDRTGVARLPAELFEECHPVGRGEHRYERFFGRPAGVLGREEVETFLLHLVRERKLSPGTHNVYAAALRFAYGAAFGRHEVTQGIPRRKRPMRLPVLLAPAQIASLLGAVTSLTVRTLLMLAHGAVLRRRAGQRHRRNFGRPEPAARRGLAARCRNGDGGRPHDRAPKWRDTCSPNGFMRAIVAVVSALVPTLCQCVPAAPSSVAQSRGAGDLSCPIEHVAAYRAGDGVYIARGCGRWVQYDCISSGRGTAFVSTVCSARGQALVHEDPE